MNNYYQILEVEPNASQDQIKNQYRFLVQAWHPDKFGSAESKAKAEEKLKQINEAFTTLKDPIRREEHDRQRSYSQSTHSYKTQENSDQQREQPVTNQRWQEKGTADTFTNSVTSFIKDLKDFVNKEQDTQNKQIEEIWTKPLHVRIQAEEAIGNVVIIENSPKGIVLNCQENSSKFRVGDRLRLHRNVPWKDFASCEIEQENGNNLVVKLTDFNNSLSVRAGSGWMLDRDIIDVRSILLGTLDTISNTPQLKEYFSNLFTGEIEPSISSNKSISANKLSENLGLNSKQNEAFCNAYATENFYLIQGPPGTGKTRIVAHLAKTFAEEGLRVLVTAFTHRAINNVLLGIAKYTKYPKILKIGQWQHKEGLRDEELGIDVLNFGNFSDCSYKSNEGVIIGATCFARRTKRLKDINFDIVIFDEAGQVTLPVAMMGMMTSKKIIFVGDHKQMAPIIVAEHENEWVKKSIFETLYKYSPGTMLEVTYRMNEEICRFSSRTFYNDKLSPENKNRFNKLNLKKKPDYFASILGNESDVFVEVDHVNRTTSSPEEAQIAAALVWELVSCGIHPKDIAVVAPYRAQGRLIRKYLYELSKQDDLSRSVVVDTVERIQGQEREVVIVSLTTSDTNHASLKADFYFQPNRLNVAITRPKVKRIVIGNPVVFNAHPKNDQIESWIKIFKSFYEQSYKVHLDFHSRG